MINWQKRIENKTFWLAIVPAVLLLLQTIASLFGYNWDISGLGTQLTAVVNAVFGVLAVVGVVVDPTTSGASDSERVLKADEPTEEPTQLGGFDDDTTEN